jgi:uncharacterized protein (TIGR01777 family)
MENGGVERVVLAGGTGLVGRHLVRTLLDAGVEPAVLTRRPDRVRLPPGARAWGWDDLGAAMAGASAVVNLCGEGIADGRWTPARKRTLVESRLGPTTRLVNAMAAMETPPSVLLNASAVGIYDPAFRGPVDEEGPRGSGFLADLCSRWEEAADRAEGSGVRVVKLRLGVVLARDGGALPRMALPVKLFLGARLGHGRQGFSWLHVDDLVGLFLEACRNPAYRGAVNATAPEALTNEAFTRALARQLHRPVFPVPAFLTRMALRALTGEMGEEMLLKGPRAVPGKAQALGFRFRHPAIEDALRDLYGY